MKLVNKQSMVIFNVEKVKNNSIPKHFYSADKKKIVINGKKVEVMMNASQTQYVAFQIDDQAYYVRDHRFFTGATYVEVVKPSAVTSEVSEPEA